MKKIVGILVILIGIALLAFLAYQSRQNSREGKPLIVIHQGSWFGDAPIYLAQEKGLYEKNGVKVEIKEVEEAQARRQLLSSGQADISAETIDMSVLDIGAGAPEKIFMALDTSLGADGIVSSAEIQKAADLKGKKIAVSKGDTPYFLLLYWLKEQGINSNRVSLEEVPNVDVAATTFLSGKVDAAGTWEPWLSKAGERSGGHVLVSSREIPGVIVDVAVARPEVLQKRKNEVAGFMKAWFEAIEYWRTNPAEANTIMAKKYNLSPSEFEELTKLIRWDDEESNSSYFGTSKQKGKAFQVTQSIIDIAFEEKIINSVLKAEDIIDLSILKN